MKFSDYLILEAKSKIVYEKGNYWVEKTKRSYDVVGLAVAGTHGITIQSFELSDDGLSLAKKYADSKDKSNSDKRIMKRREK